MDKYVVMGNPIAHSKSPEIHQAFAKAAGEDISYEKMEVPQDGFNEAVKTFQKAGGKGCNVTVPFKEQAWALVDERKPNSEISGAVNVIKMDNSKLIGDNTDGVGLVIDLKNNYGITLAGKKILILGAGGAVRGVLQPILNEQPASLTIANRTKERATALAQEFRPVGHIEVCRYQALVGQSFDIIINGTSASLSGEVPPVPLGIVEENGCCYDMAYGDEDTAFVRWAQAQGVNHAYDGMGMLVEQAAESYLFWRGIRPKTEDVIRLLRKATSSG